jgi:general secretion pathway protein I
MHQGSRAKAKFAKGFTLIEIIVALAILGIALTVIIELFSGGLRLGRFSKEYTNAVNYARMKMEEIESQENIEEGTEEGEFDPIFHWRVGMKKVDILPAEKSADFKPPVELFQIRVDVLWKSGSQERSASIESYRTIKGRDHEKKS